MPKALPREEHARRFVAADDSRHIGFLNAFLIAHDFLAAFERPGAEALMAEARGANPQNVAAEIATVLRDLAAAHRKMLVKKHRGLTGALIKLRALCDTELGVLDKLSPLQADALMDVFYSLRHAALWEEPDTHRHRPTGPRRMWHPDPKAPRHVKPKVIAREGNVIRLSTCHHAA